MFIPGTYGIAFLLMLLSMICWGSWANTQKATGEWRFELFYWDYVWGIVICAVVLGLTAGRTQASSADSFFHNLGSASLHNFILAFAGGIIFNIANVLLVAAIAIAGMAVAFPIGIGLALVIGSVLNYMITPKGNPLLLFGGVALVVIAIIFDAMAYRKHSGGGRVTRTGIILSLLCGVGMGLFYPFVAKALTGERHLVPYTVAFIFALGALVSNFPLNYAFMKRPVAGDPLSAKDYFAGSGRMHAWGIVGGLIWGVGTVSNFVASYAQMVGPATSYALGQGATMISAIWGVFVWKEFRGAQRGVKALLALMFVFFILGLVSVALAPVIK
ncbi:MAG: AcrB/AcrD/AcrF family protein [Acidobacteriota bacterium]|nr:AcrB/AcrD/AcrF family protein [Acidobacteriota bacterium]